jgi:hypothetical protein
MGCATLWELFSQTHLVTHGCHQSFPQQKLFGGKKALFSFAASSCP